MQPDGGGLAGAVGAEQAEDLARRDVEVDAVDGDGVTEHWRSPMHRTAADMFTASLIASLCDSSPRRLPGRAGRPRRRDVLVGQPGHRVGDEHARADRQRVAGRAPRR